nr:hypothetical protein [Granulicella sp. L46]
MSAALSITWGYAHQKRGRGSATARCSGWRSAKFECVDRNFFTQRSRKNDDGDIRTDAPCEFQRGQAIEGWTGGIRENQISSVLFKERQKCGLTIDPRELAGNAICLKRLVEYLSVARVVCQVKNLQWLAHAHFLKDCRETASMIAPTPGSSNALKDEEERKLDFI